MKMSTQNNFLLRHLTSIQTNSIVLTTKIDEGELIIEKIKYEENRNSVDFFYTLDSDRISTILGF